MIWRPAAQSAGSAWVPAFAGEILDLLAGQRGDVQPLDQGAAQLVVTGKTCGFQDGVGQRGIVGWNHAEADLPAHRAIPDPSRETATWWVSEVERLPVRRMCSVISASNGRARVALHRRLGGRNRRG